MKFRYVASILFIIALVILFKQINYVENSNIDTNIPDFSLENSYIEHYIEGNLTFKVNAKKIDIYADNNYFFYQATAEFNNQMQLTADIVEANLNEFIFYATNNIEATNSKFKYYGNKIKYNVKEKKFFGYNKGKIVIKPL